MNNGVLVFLEVLVISPAYLFATLCFLRLPPHHFRRPPAALCQGAIPPTTNVSLPPTRLPTLPPPPVGTYATLLWAPPALSTPRRNAPTTTSATTVPVYDTITTRHTQTTTSAPRPLKRQTLSSNTTTLTNAGSGDFKTTAHPLEYDAELGILQADVLSPSS